MAAELSVVHVKVRQRAARLTPPPSPAGEAYQPSRSRFNGPPIARNRAEGELLTFALCSPTIGLCPTVRISDLSPVFARAWPQLMRLSSSALVFEWSNAPRHKFVHPGCTLMSTESQAGRDPRFLLECLLERRATSSPHGKLP